ARDDDDRSRTQTCFEPVLAGDDLQDLGRVRKREQDHIRPLGHFAWGPCRRRSERHGSLATLGIAVERGNEMARPPHALAEAPSPRPHPDPAAGLHRVTDDVSGARRRASSRPRSLVARTYAPKRSTTSPQPPGTTIVVFSSSTIAGPASSAPAPSVPPSYTGVSTSRRSSGAHTSRAPARAASGSALPPARSP